MIMCNLSSIQVLRINTFLNPRYAETESLYTQAPGLKELVAEFETLGGSVGFATTVLRVMLLSCCCESIAACCAFSAMALAGYFHAIFGDCGGQS
jgi:hypothetical protein